MMIGSSSAQNDSLSLVSTSAPVFFGGGTRASPLTSHHHVPQSAAPINRPGTMPARNSLEIETLPATPKITKPIEGGITGPMMPVAAIRPPERALSWPAATIIGSSSAVSAAASATAEPESADSRQAATMAT